jgi:hypothetical protein
MTGESIDGCLESTLSSLVKLLDHDLELRSGVEQ